MRLLNSASTILRSVAVVAAAAFITSCADTKPTPKSSATPVSVPFDKVTLQDDFWRPRLLTQKHTLVPFSIEKNEPAIENLRRVGAYLRGEKIEKLLPKPFYVASDLFKVMEGAAYLLTIEPDAELEAQMDAIIDIIGEAQCPDGYLYEHHIVPEKYRHKGNYWGSGDKPYSYVLFSHELYNMGHMYEGAIAYYRATGKRKWLDIAEKSAQHINRVFFEGDPAYNGGKPVNQAPGHQEIEMALIKLYQVTDNPLYLEMARKFIDIRGVTYRPEGIPITTTEYSQQHLPVREQYRAVGHSVRATYLYAGMADVVAMTGDTTLLPALDSVWHDIVDRKMHITGGLGAVPGIEGFGPEYVLPNKETYNETCSAVGNVMFNYRMFLMSRNAKYTDVAEVALYNNVLAGVNIEGNRFFYVNPLEADGRRAFNHGHSGRAPWFNTACCPSNLARLIPQIPGMIYSHTDDEIFCGFYAGSSTTIPIAQGGVALTQRTQYPFDGRIEIEVTPEAESAEFTLWLRIPTWCTGSRFVSGELYSYADNTRSRATAKVNGRRVRAEVIDGMLPVCRKWKAGDVVTLSLDMPVRYSVADERVKADSNRVCLTRGPLVLCAESADNSFNPSTYFINNIGAQGTLGTYTEGVLTGIPNITLNAAAATAEAEESAPLILLPYYAWNNRGNAAMNVWFALDAPTARKSMNLTVGNIADVTATHTYVGDDVIAIADGRQPKSSGDRSIPRWTSWPQKGEPQQVVIKLRKRQTIESVQVYWYDDKGGVQIPVSWSMDYLVDGEWRVFTPYITDRFGTYADQFNMVHPDVAIEAEALRLNMTPHEDSTVGILEVVVE